MRVIALCNRQFCYFMLIFSSRILIHTCITQGIAVISTYSIKNNTYFNFIVFQRMFSPKTRLLVTRQQRGEKSLCGFVSGRIQLVRMAVRCSRLNPIEICWPKFKVASWIARWESGERRSRQIGRGPFLTKRLRIIE